jgi:hypothetical protein
MKMLSPIVGPRVQTFQHSRSDSQYFLYLSKSCRIDPKTTIFGGVRGPALLLSFLAIEVIANQDDRKESPSDLMTFPVSSHYHQDA